jgi:ABC-2 type transport system ATP-binding protein
LPRFLKVRELFQMLADIHPNFSGEKAVKFLEGTDVKLGALIGNLSKGCSPSCTSPSSLAIDAKLLVTGRTHARLDITYRKRFYRRLLEDYMTAERTLLITRTRWTRSSSCSPISCSYAMAP